MRDLKTITLEEIVDRGYVIPTNDQPSGPYFLERWVVGKIKNWIRILINRWIGEPLRKWKTQKWLRNRQEKQQNLINYLTANPEQLVLVKKVITYLFQDRRFSEERAFYGGSSEIRHWERVQEPGEKQEIKNLAKALGCYDQIGHILSIIFLALPELFLASSRSHPQKKLNDYYHRTEKGDYAFFNGLLRALN